MAGYTSGSLLEAGSDTTAATLTAFVQAMIVFPEVQKIARQELDEVVGPDRMPTIEDMEKLHYIRCCVKETLRWMPTNILGVPHAVTQDDEYMGYRIPKGAGVVLNVWFVLLALHTCSKLTLGSNHQGYPHGSKIDIETRGNSTPLATLMISRA